MPTMNTAVIAAPRTVRLRSSPAIRGESLSDGADHPRPRRRRTAARASPLPRPGLAARDRRARRPALPRLLHVGRHARGLLWLADRPGRERRDGLLRPLGVPAVPPVPGRRPRWPEADRAARLRPPAGAAHRARLLARADGHRALAEPRQGLLARLVALLRLPTGLQPAHVSRR